MFHSKCILITLISAFVFYNLPATDSLQCYEHGVNKALADLFTPPSPVKCPAAKPVCFFRNYRNGEVWDIGVNVTLGCETTAFCKGVVMNNCRHNQAETLCCCNSDLCNINTSPAMAGKRKCSGSEDACLKGEDYCFSAELSQITTSASVNSTGHASSGGCASKALCDKIAGGGKACKTTDAGAEKGKTKVCCCDSDNCNAESGQGSGPNCPTCNT